MDNEFREIPEIIERAEALKRRFGYSNFSHRALLQCRGVQ
jgi:hypothetical protein